MHIVFVHQNFPAQFGQIAARLVRDKGYQCTFVSEREPGTVAGIRKLQYHLAGSATARTHICAQSFENEVWHAAAIFEALKPLRNSLEPDLIVGHSIMGPTLFLRELFPDTPVINYFEYFYHPRGTDLDFRLDLWPVPEHVPLRSRARNAMILLDLENCQAGYTPTEFQSGLFPDEYRPKLRVIHDGIDTDFWHRLEPPERRLGPHTFGPTTRIVTYVSRGMESMRGFDIFMQAAKLICRAYPDVVFLVVGEDRVAYGGDLLFTGGKSFKEWVLTQGDYDLDRILFLGRLPTPELVQVFSLSDLHIYLTVPFVLSWSLLDAMACGCTVLASDTAPVREVVRDGDNGLLRGFFDPAGLAEAAVRVLRDPEAHRRTLGRAAERTVRERYSLGATLPRIAAFYDAVAARR